MNIDTITQINMIRHSQIGTWSLHLISWCKFFLCPLCISDTWLLCAMRLLPLPNLHVYSIITWSNVQQMSSSLYRTVLTFVFWHNAAATIWLQTITSKNCRKLWAWCTANVKQADICNVRFIFPPFKAGPLLQHVYGRYLLTGNKQMQESVFVKHWHIHVALQLPTTQFLDDKDNTLVSSTQTTLYRVQYAENVCRLWFVQNEWGHPCVLKLHFVYAHAWTNTPVAL